MILIAAYSDVVKITDIKKYIECHASRTFISSMKTLTWKRKRAPLKSEHPIFGNDDKDGGQTDELLTVAKRPRGV